MKTITEHDFEVFLYGIQRNVLKSFSIFCSERSRIALNLVNGYLTTFAFILYYNNITLLNIIKAVKDLDSSRRKFVFYKRFNSLIKFTQLLRCIRQSYTENIFINRFQIFTYFLLCLFDGSLVA